MFARQLIAAAALAAIGTVAHAGSSDANTSGKTRAEVIAERDAYLAQNDNLLHLGESYGTVMAPSVSASDREEVIAQFSASGPTNEVVGEAYGTVEMAEFQSEPVQVAESTFVGSVDVYAYQSSLFRVNDAYGAQPASSTPIASYETSMAADETVVLWVPVDDEVLTLQPGEAVLLVPIDDSIMVEGE